MGKKEEGRKWLERLSLKNMENAVLNGSPKIHWEDKEHFWYLKEAYDENGDKVNYRAQADCAAGTIQVAEEPERGKEGEEQSTAEGKETKAGAAKQNKETVVSPDGKYEIFSKEYNLYLRELEGGKETQLTFEGEKDYEFGGRGSFGGAVQRAMKGEKQPPVVLWAPDSRKFLTCRLDQRLVKELHVIRSYEEEGAESIRPRHYAYKCSFPEDEHVPLAYLYLCSIENGNLIKIEEEPIHTGGGLFEDNASLARWMEDSSAVYYTWVSRGYQKGAFIVVDGSTGESCRIVEEETNTFLNLGTHKLDGFDGYRFSNYLTKDKKRLIWWSERDGRAQLYLYERDGRLVQKLTQGDYIVSTLKGVDEEAGYIYFMASNLEGFSDPYYHALCRIRMDGTGFLVLTPEDAEHTVTMGPDFAYAADTYSRVDQSPVTVIRDLSGQLIMEVERADISRLLELGYIIPERFTVKASDGVTDLYGILIRPVQQKDGETVKYPVIDYMYGGMQTTFVPKTFSYTHPQNREVYGGLEVYAQLGYAGIMLDGLGTPGREKWIHDVSFQNIHGCAGLKDHVHCAAELAEKYPFLDFERVGIWGNSGGGCATSRALLEYPDFYKVGVSSAGNHDQRMYNTTWTERYYGLYNKEIYEKGDNTKLAPNLKGKLFIVHGAVDDNVSMSQSLRLVDALIREDKDFDFLILPEIEHNVPAEPYFIRRKMEYFVENL